MGGGVWAMHFVGMLAFGIPGLDVTYDVGLTGISLLVPIFVTGISFFVIGFGQNSPLLLASSGLFMGLGIVAMHYIGMMAMKMPADIQYDLWWVLISILIAIGASTVALWLSLRTSHFLIKIAAAVAMGLAVSGMHYAAMQNICFTANPARDMAHRWSSLSQLTLALAVSASTFLILFLALIAAMFDRRFALLAEREARALRFSEERFRTLYAKTPLPLHSLDQHGCIENVSDAWLELMGYADAEVLGRPLVKFMEEASARQAVKSDWPRLLETGELKDAEYRVLTKAGDVLEVLVSAQIERGESGEFVRVLSGLTDVTGRKRAEDALRQSQKMEAVGQLTGGLAHDFNNMLSIIAGSLERLERYVSQGKLKDTERYFAAAQAASKRAAALTHRLLAFSRQQTLDPKATRINQLVTGMDDLLRQTVGPDIIVEIVGAAALWTTLVDPHQLENALLNLCINARDAMPDGGRITIETSNRWLDDRTAREQNIAPGQYVSLCVSDTGCGMSADLIAKAFNPFFTTKPIGQGTGLGLSMVYGFARQSGGQVRIYSEIGQGTMVCIYLPRHYGEEVGLDEQMPSKPKSAEQGETVLVVDDEPEVRMLVVDVLVELGYGAIEAGDGLAAVKVMQSDARIDLLVTDVGLPGGMNGRQVADAGRAIRNDLKILFMTGYAENAAVGNGQLEPGVAVMTKPFSIDALANRIKEMISAP